MFLTEMGDFSNNLKTIMGKYCHLIKKYCFHILKITKINCILYKF